MASVEFIQKRIEGKQKEIATLEKKIERILKAQASNWENNPYYYNERDLMWAQKDLAAAKEGLADWENKLKEEGDKAASRNVPAITEFLDLWEQRCIEFYLDAYERYKVAVEEMRADYKRMSEEMDALGYRARWDKNDPNYEEYHRLDKEQDEFRKDFYREWNYVTQFLDHEKPYEEYMRHFIAEEKKRKYDFLLDKVCSIVGTITDASNLRVGAKGDLNGYIVGTDGKASVQTIGAGGWNIQVFHYRTLIKRMK